MFPLEPGIAMSQPSGIAFGSGNLYIADRSNSKIHWYKDFSPTGPLAKPAILDVDESPEFTLYVSG